MLQSVTTYPKRQISKYLIINIDVFHYHAKYCYNEICTDKNKFDFI